MMQTQVLWPNSDAVPHASPTSQTGLDHRGSWASAPGNGNHHDHLSWGEFWSSNTSAASQDEGSLSSALAMDFTRKATKHLTDENYAASLQAYRQALEIYQEKRRVQQNNEGGVDGSSISNNKNNSSFMDKLSSGSFGYSSERSLSSVIAACNAASCYRNMGAIHRIRHEYHDAVECWKSAEELYRISKCCLQRHHQQKQPEGQKSQLSDAGPPNASSNPAAMTEGYCLDLFLIETLQGRAVLQHKYLANSRAAILCHEEVLSLLLTRDRHSTLSSSSSGSLSKLNSRPVELSSFHALLQATVVDNVHFLCLTDDQYSELLMNSLESLGHLYRITKQHGDLSAYERGLHLLRKSVHPELLDDNARSFRSITHILRNLSEIYFDMGQLDRAVDALQEAMDIKLSRSEEPSFEALEAMDKMGLANEQLEQYDKALACYEKTLLARSRYLGEDHIDVAKSLVNVARVMELQGNAEGGMDLYRAAHAIYTRKVTAQDFEVAGDDAQIILQLIPAVLEQGRFEEAIAFLNKCLLVAENDPDGEKYNFDKSQIYYDLGQAYIGLHDYVSATVCLVEAAKEKDGVSGQQVYELLKQVEQSRREESRLSSSLTQSSSSKSSITMEDPLVTEQFPYDEQPAGVASEAGVLSESDDTHADLPAQRYGPVQAENSAMAISLKSKGLTDSPEDKARVSKREAPKSNRKATRRRRGAAPGSSDDEEATAFYDSELEAGLGRIPRSDVSTSSGGAELLSADALPAIEIDPVPAEDEGTGGKSERRQASLSSGGKSRSGDEIRDGLADLEAFKPQTVVTLTSAKSKRAGSFSPPSSPPSSPTSKSSSVQRSLPNGDENKVSTSTDPVRRSKIFVDKFRRRRGGFRSLPEDKGEEKPASYLPSENEYHFDGPIQFIEVLSNSWEDAVSDITTRIENPNQAEGSGQEWWWGVTSDGFRRWFPADYVSKAVEAAEGFLSAKAIHAQVQPSPTPLDMLSDEESTEESASMEERDHPSHLGIASRPGQYSRPWISEKAEQKGSRRTASPAPRFDSVLTVAGQRTPPGGSDFSSEIAFCLERLEKEKKELGKSHPTVVTTIFTLAVLYSRNRSTGLAIEAATEALRIQKANGNSDDAARSLHFLADLYLHQKQYKSSLSYYTEALRIESSHFGYASDQAARTLNCIGTVRSLQNEFALAMESHQEALRILKECHGEDLKHPLVSDTLCQIGAVYYRERNSFSKNANHEAYTTFIEAGMLEIIGRAHEDRGCYKMAISFFEEKLQFLESTGNRTEHLEEAATTLNSLGMLSARAGLYFEAVDYYEKALSIQLQLGCDQVDLATARVLTGAVHFQLGDWRKALRLLQEALVVLQDELGDEHETVAATLYQIGMVQAALCQHDPAMDALSRALDIQNEILGEDHPATLRTLREVGRMYTIYESELDTAFEIFTDVLAAQKLIHNDRHPNIAETLHCIGCAYTMKGDFANAIRVLEECYYMRVETLGWDHPLQALTLHEIARIHLRRERTKKSLHICEAVLSIQRDSLGERHVEIGRTLATKASCLAHKGKHTEDSAMKCYEEALSIAVDAVGTSHPLIADIRSQMAVLHLRKCQFDDARKSIQTALEIYRLADFDDDHPSILDAKRKLERIEREEMLCV